jgi:autotransporter-associated beta strand protein
MNTPPASITFRRIASLAALLSLSPLAQAQTSGVWTLNNSGVWSSTGNWNGSAIADGAGATADFSQLNISTARTVTIDGAVASRTLGTLLFGDIDSTHGYTIAASGGGTLTFNNNGSAAAITQDVNSGANIISAPVLLADSLNTNNNSASLLTVSGTISSSTVGTKTITNQGSGAGGVTLSGVISDGSGTVAIIQDSATSQLTLSGANTFTGGVTIKQGTLAAGNNTAALGSGTVLLGDTTGNKDATLLLQNGLTYANAITVQAGSSNNTLTINAGALNKAVLSGAITLNNNLTFALTAPGGASGVSTTATLPYLTVSGAIGGTGNLTINQTGGSITSNAGGSPQSSGYTFSGAITTTGSLTDASTGSGWKTISGNISNISSLNQNSANSMLILSGTNTYSGQTNVNSGVLRSGSAGGLSTNSAINVADGGSLQITTTQSTTQTLTLSGNGTSYSEGALSGTNVATYAGGIVLAADATVADSLANTTLTLSGGVTGSGRTLTTAGVGNVTISGAIATGSGGLTKEGTGLLTLSSANTYTGATTLKNGTLSLTNASALGGGGAITFDGGILRHNSTNMVDYASRIVNSTGPVAIDTNGQNITYAGNIDATNTGGLLKIGSARLTLSGTNSFSGPIAINAGVLAISATTAIPSIGNGSIFLDSAGALNTGGAYANVQAWLDSDNIATASTGAIALTGNSTENIDFTGYDNLSLGASSTSTYTGTITAANSTYRLGGGGATLTLSGTNALTGTNALVVSNGTVTLSGANNLSGTTTVSSGTLNLSAAGTLANSAATVGSGSTLAITAATSGSAVTRASSLKLTGGTLTVTGNATANSIDQLTGALTISSGGNSTVTLTQSSAKNVRLSAGDLVREAGATALIRGTSLGVNSLASQTTTSSNISLTSAPSLVGNGGTGTDRSIFVGLVGDTAANGTGFGATGGLLTYDSTNGVRLLSGSDYKTSITDGQTALDNIQLTSTGTTATTTLALDTTINSLSLSSTTATGANVQLAGAGKLTLNSGVIYAGSVTATTASGISNTIDFNGREGVILTGGTANLTLSGVLSNTDGNGLTIYAPGRTVTLSGASANTYTGTTTVNGGTLSLGKTAGVNSIIGNILINSGATVSHSTANQIADTANVTVDGGTFNFLSDTINNLTVTNNGSAAAGAVAVAFNVNGITTLSNGGTLNLVRSQSINGLYDSSTTLGALNITNRASGAGAYTAITLNHGVGYAQSGAKLILGGDVTFTGNSTNTNTVLIDAIKGSGRQGVIELTASAGNRTFTIGNGAAATDLKITAALLDGTGVTSGLVKAGAGTLALSGANTYSGNTAVNAGALTLDQSGSLTFYIGANGVNNAVTGSGTVTFNGSFNFDFTNAVATGGNSWLIVDTGTLSESFTGTFAITGFTENANVWTNGSGYSFSESTGILTYTAVPEPSTYALLGGVASLLLAAFRRRRTAI